ncbi:MAG: hypothetical protein CMB56_005220, partial [Methanobacteriota archaeon]
MVSTYHVQQLVLAVVGDTAEVDIIGSSNEPVHDFSPSPGDKADLLNSDIFFYHGLKLEPWVDKAISEMGDDGPTIIKTHAMPTGEITLDYESILVDDLCSALSENDRLVNNLMSYKNQASELNIDIEYLVHQLTFPAPDSGEDLHDDHGDHDDHDDHDDHGDHDDHDDHDDH